jgi:hypothetical protein
MSVFKGMGIPDSTLKDVQVRKFESSSNPNGRIQKIESGFEAIHERSESLAETGESVHKSVSQSSKK